MINTQAKSKLLIVDDDVLARASLSQIFAEFGHNVRTAEDGVSALLEIRRDAPNIVLSYIDIPGMSAFQFLMILRRRFPAIQVIAMRAVLSIDRGMQPVIAADAFFEKGTNLSSLLQIVEAMVRPERPPSLQRPGTLTPVWNSMSGKNKAGEAYVVLDCPKCLRSFPCTLGDAIVLVNEAPCVFCSNLIHYSIVQPTDPPMREAFQWKPGAGAQKPLMPLHLN